MLERQMRLTSTNYTRLPNHDFHILSIMLYLNLKYSCNVIGILSIKQSIIDKTGFLDYLIKQIKQFIDFIIQPHTLSMVLRTIARYNFKSLYFVSRNHNGIILYEKRLTQYL